MNDQVEETHAVAERVRETVIGVLDPRPSRAADLAGDADLWENGLSSLGSASLLVRIEDEFGIEFPDDALNRSTFASLDALTAAVLSLVDGAGSVR